MRFKKIYIEITNSCNFDCSFCFKTKRSTRFMSPDEFRGIANKVRPFTNFVYLHVMGEPLLHPKLDEILSIAAETGLNVNITTNGGLIEKKKAVLLNYPIRQINISLHDAEENILPENLDAYLEQVLLYSSEAADKTYINLRLWNSGVETSTEFNQFCLEKIANRFEISIEDLKTKGKDSSIKLADHIFLQLAPRFEWPDGEQTRVEENKTCYALRDHIAILTEGTIVPCCLDADANINLGNILTDDLKQVIQSERAMSIKKGFEQHKVVEPFCRSCGFLID